MRKIVFWLIVLMGVSAYGQSAPASRPFSKDEVAIYREFLRTYLEYGDSLTDLLGLDPDTGQFRVEDLGGDPHRQEAVQATLVLPQWSGRRLPRSVISIASEAHVRQRIEAQGNLRDPAKLTPDEGPDGYIRTHLVLSEIAFDKEHRHAVLIYSADCRCKGGGGASILYEQKNGRWKRSRVLGGWQG